MAVRKKIGASRTEWHNAALGELTDSPRHQDEELELDEELRNHLKAVIRKRITKEWTKGLLAFPVAIAGPYLMWWSSKLDGFPYWLGTLSGLVIMAVGMGYAREF